MIEKIRKFAHKVGLNRVVIFRRGLDKFKNSRVPFVFRIQGFRIKGMPWRYLIDGVYEPEVTELLKTIIKPGWTVYEVGADYGYFTILISKLMGTTGSMIAFEPYKLHFNKYLLPNIKRNKVRNVQAVPLALAEVPGVLNYSSDIRSAVAGDLDISVEATTLDKFNASLSPIDLMILDVEGSELGILKGGINTIANSPHFRLIVEIYPRVQANSGGSQALLDYIRQMGLRISLIAKDGRLSEATDGEILNMCTKTKTINVFCKKSL